jgi:hypothetical protein
MKGIDVQEQDLPVRKSATGVMVIMSMLIAFISTITGSHPDHVSAAGTTAVLVGAGDISSCNNDNDLKTARLLRNISGTIFTTGDNVYESGTSKQYVNCYKPTWGKYKDRTKPVPGNHEYQTSNASGYFHYFGSIPKYYAYNKGNWRIYALNSEINTAADSPQATWLKKDLAANPRKCVMAYWHRPRWSSGSTHGNDRKTQALWNILYDAKAELVVAGHEHNYERFAPMNKNGEAVDNGLREFVVGTGGVGHYSFGDILPASQARNADTYGVLKLTLRAGGYDWEFIPIEGQSYTDSGSAKCQ